MPVKKFKLVINNSNKKNLEDIGKINSKNINYFIAKGLKSNELELKIELLNSEVNDLKNQINELTNLNNEMVTLMTLFLGTDE